jgi:anti-sigma-K factor RskA
MSEITDHNGKPRGDLPEDELLAAEYALGVLGAAERAQVERRIVRDRAFAGLVAAWEVRLAPWAAEIADVNAPPHVWDRIAEALPPQHVQSVRLWDSLAFWRVFGLASALAAACLAAFVYLGTLSQAPPLVAAIDGGGHHHFVATIDAKRGTVAVVPAAFTADATRVPELWLIPADGKPRPLGLLSADRTVTIAIPTNLAAQTVTNAVLAVSLEPHGGSPTGLPTGPVIAQGKLTNL